MTTVSDTATENEANVTEVDVPTESEVTEASAAKDPAKDLTAFWDAVNAINLEAPNYDAVVAEYDKLDRGTKMSAGHAIKAQIMSVLEDDNFTKAKVLSGVSKAVASSTSTSDGGDPTEELVNRMAGFYLAYKQLSDANSNLAERVKAAVAAVSEDKGDETVAALLAKRLVETKMGRKPRESGGTRHNVGKHIAQVFADLPDGTFLSSKQIADAKSEEYGDDSASKVSIDQHLKGNFEQDGLSVVYDGDKVTGVRKGAEPEA